MARKRRFIPPILAVLIFLPTQFAAAGTINASSCSQATVQSAINSANAGDTVVIPSGTCTYTTSTAETPSVTINKAITVQGQTVCTGRANSLSCTDNTIINDNTGTQFEENPFDLTVSNSRLTGITIVDTRGVVDYGPYVETGNDTTGWRVDHCHISSNIGGTGTGEGIQADGYGLIDHVYIQNVGTAFPAMGTSAHDAKYPGDYSWTQPLSLGTANAVYIEDNELNYTQAVLNGQDDYSGARVVFRYNDVQGTNFGTHGLDSGGLRSVMQAEVYNNTFENPGTHISQLNVSRGGTQVNFNNTVSGSGGSFDTYIELANYRSDPSCSSTGECGAWGTCDGTNAIDQNLSGAHGAACQDQIGRGGPNLAGFGTVEASAPDYFWNNNYKGSSPALSNFVVCGYQDCTAASAYHILNNRDFFIQVSNFTGASGVGTGVLSARPSTCTARVGYFATDSNTLYQCAGANVWKSYYTPYTYPNPLQNAGSAPPAVPPAPTGLAAVAN